MLADRYDLALSTASEAARDAYVQGCDLALTSYPGAIEAFDRATAADPSFSLPHAAKAQVLMREGNVAAARAALVAAKDLATGVLEREASHIAYFDLAFAGQTDAAIDALYAHLTALAVTKGPAGRATEVAIPIGLNSRFRRRRVFSDRCSHVRRRKDPALAGGTREPGSPTWTRWGWPDLAIFDVSCGTP